MEMAMDFREKNFAFSAPRKRPRDYGLENALAAYVRSRGMSLKEIERFFAVTPAAARSIQYAQASRATLRQALHRLGWGGAHEIVGDLLGHSYPEYLQALIERESHVQRDREAERDRVRQMEARALEFGAVPSRASP